MLGLDPNRTVSGQAGTGELGAPGDMLCKALDIVDPGHCAAAVGSERLPVACECPW